MRSKDRQKLNHACTRRFKKIAKKVPGKAGQRYWKNVGLGFKTPKEAIEGERSGPAAMSWVARAH